MITIGMKGHHLLVMAILLGLSSSLLGQTEFIDDERPGDARSSFEDGLGRYFESIDRRRPKTRFEKMHRSTLLEFAPLVDQSRMSTVKVFKGDEVRVLGTVVAQEGLIITKASEIVNDQELAVQLPNKEIVPAELVEVNEENDLALLWVHQFDLTPITWAPGSDLPIGSLLASSGTVSLPLTIGTVSLQLRNLLESKKGFLGISMEAAKDGSGLYVVDVLEGTGAQDAGLQSGDLIQAIDGVAMATTHALSNTVSESEPGDVVVLQIIREEETLMVEITLGDKDSGMGYQMPMHEQLDQTARMGGRVSRKRSGYPAAIQHDMLLKPNQCGGPLVNIDGHAVGVNIARASRVKSYAIPSEVILDWLGDPNELALTVLETRVKNAASARLAAEEALEEAKAMELDVRAALQDLQVQREAVRLEAESAIELSVEPEEGSTTEAEGSSPQ